MAKLSKDDWIPEKVSFLSLRNRKSTRELILFPHCDFTKLNENYFSRMCFGF